VITSDVRTLEVGTTGQVWGRITDRLEQDMSGLTIQLATVSPAGVVSAWAAPAAIDAATAGVLRAALVHVAVEVGTWRLLAKMTNGSLVEVMNVGAFYVVAVP
jgi:hypothetical protein